MKRSEWRGRYILLGFDCMLVIGIYFCMDIPSALQSHIEDTETVNCTATEDSGNGSVVCCIDCLGLGSDRYNLLYTISSWTSAIMVLPVGFLIDKIGNRVSALLFTGIASSGSILFAMASLPPVRGTETMFPLMMVGRLLLGAGTGPSRIVRDRILAAWFRDKLSMAFGIAVSTMGLGSVCTFVLTSNLAEWIGLMPTLFVGAGVCCTTFVSAVFVCFLDYYGSKKIAGSRKCPMQLKKRPSATVNKSSYWETIRSFSSSFWVLCVMTATFYSFQLPFTANGSKFIRERYGYQITTASYINGVVYDVSVGLSPLAGILMGKIGNRGWVAFISSLLTLPVGALLLFTDMAPLIGFIWIGITFTFTVVSLWSSIPHTVSHMSLGTANGVASCMLDTFTGLTSLGIGQIMKQCSPDDTSCVDDSWRMVYLVLFGHVAICTFSGIVLNCVCGKKDSSLNGIDVMSRQTSFGPMHCSISRGKDASTDDLAAINSISRESSVADLHVLSTGIDKNMRQAFTKYKPTLPRGLKVKFGETLHNGNISTTKIKHDNSDPIQFEIEVSQSVEDEEESHFNHGPPAKFVDIEFEENKGQDNATFEDTEFEKRTSEENLKQKTRMDTIP